jgi:hypothetical protein
MSAYGTDVLAWAEEQAALLRRRAAGELVNDSALDWPNIAEEIESVGQSERYRIQSHIGTVIEHLIKLQASPAVDPRNGWRTSVRNARRGIERSLKNSPSLRREVGEMIAEETSAAKRDVAAVLKDYGEQPVVPIEGMMFTEEQVTGHWFPHEPAA